MVSDAGADVVERLVREHPGLHLRELQRVGGFALGTLRYHLGRLEQAERVRALRDGSRLRYFPANVLPRGHAATLAALRVARQRRVAIALLKRGPSTHGELRVETGLPASTVSISLQALQRSGLVQTIAGRRFTLDSPALVTEVLRTYRQSFLDRLVDQALDLFTNDR